MEADVLDSTDSDESIESIDPLKEYDANGRFNSTPVDHLLAYVINHENRFIFESANTALKKYFVWYAMDNTIIENEFYLKFLQVFGASSLSLFFVS